jgi:hypothetical protein
LARAYAATTCSLQCAPFKNSPGTYATCCKQHAATAAARPPIKPAVIKSRFPKPLTTGQLHQGQVKKVDDINKKANTLTQKLQKLVDSSTAPPASPPTSTAPPSSGGGAVSVGCTPGQFPLVGFTISNTEAHGKHSDPGAPKTPREESYVPQPGTKFKYSTIVTIPQNEKSDDLTIEFNGKAHTGSTSNRDGHKWMVSIGQNSSKSGFYVQDDTTYNQDKSTSGLNGTVLERGGTYGVVVTSEVSGSDVITSLYVSSGGRTANLVRTVRVPGGATNAGLGNTRIGNRIDNINSPCGRHLSR